MLFFRDHQWLVAHGASLFSAYITPDTRTRDEVFWMLELRFHAAGPPWRRVRYWERPCLCLQVSSFKPQLEYWTDLERLSFWEDQEDESAFIGRNGILDVSYHPKSLGEKSEDSSFVRDFVWRVAAREGGWLTVELAALAEGRSLADLLAGKEVLVTPDGQADREEPGVPFWKQNAQLYLLENVPFGVVTVRVPHNARDPEAYALARARALTGVDVPEHIVVNDYSKWEKTSESLREDVFVHLHFNGFYED
ncbi:MAG: hypothetical protein HY674_22910 [Chloroflexi bacterium]|nr:hypothetical protein [Chloroflexota bacterium]